jgi:hypothetical protein
MQRLVTQETKHQINEYNLLQYKYTRKDWPQGIPVTSSFVFTSHTWWEKRKKYLGCCLRRQRNVQFKSIKPLKDFLKFLAVFRRDKLHSIRDRNTWILLGSTSRSQNESRWSWCWYSFTIMSIKQQCWSVKRIHPSAHTNSKNLT